MESIMKREVTMLLIAAACAMAAQPISFAMAQETPDGVGSSLQDHLLPPRVERVAVRATLLHWGMPGADVERIMGAPAEVQVYNSGGGNVRVLAYPTEPIATRVSICDGQLCAVRLDVAGIDDRVLPPYTRRAWLGMDRGSVLRTLGAPAEVRSFDRYGMHLEHMLFERPGQPDVGVLFIGGRVAAKRVGKSLPADILRLVLPLPADPVDEETDAQNGARTERHVRVGMTMSEAQALLGAPKIWVDSTFKGWPVAYAVYQTSANGSFGSFTFIDGVLTEFACDDRTPLDQILNGG